MDFDSINSQSASSNRVSTAALRGTAAMMMMKMMITRLWPPGLYAQYERGIFRSMGATITEGSRGFYTSVVVHLFTYLFMFHSKRRPLGAA